MNALLSELVAVSGAVESTSARLEKRAVLATYLRSLRAGQPSRLRLAASYLSGEVPQGSLQVGWALLRKIERSAGEELPLLAALSPAPPQPLTLDDVDQTFQQLAELRGPGAVRRRQGLLRDLLARAGSDEARFLRKLLLSELRQGALRAVVLEAVAEALDLEVAALRRAVMFAGLGEVVEAAAQDGASALGRFGLRPLHPVEPMLAASADDVDSALQDLGAAVAEWKLDGVRIQLHRQGREVRVFTRQLRDVTANLPQLVELAVSLDAPSFVLDGEAVALDEEGRPAHFQDLMSRISREGGAAEKAPVAALFFDLLYLEGRSLIDRPLSRRRQALEDLVGLDRCVPQTAIQCPADASAAFEAALAAGHEGVVLKALDSTYAAGRRGSHWRKLKPAITLDLVILAAEWGSGRRRGFLSNLHLGARDADDPKSFHMLGKTFKGLTDAMLAEMTEDLLSLQTHRGEGVVYVRPERVVEIAFDGLQRSSRYDAGLALRFARVKRFRPDKNPHEATSLAELRELARSRSL